MPLYRSKAVFPLNMNTSVIMDSTEVWGRSDVQFHGLTVNRFFNGKRLSDLLYLRYSELKKVVPHLSGTRIVRRKAEKIRKDFANSVELMNSVVVSHRYFSKSTISFVPEKAVPVWLLSLATWTKKLSLFRSNTGREKPWISGLVFRLERFLSA